MREYKKLKVYQVYDERATEGVDWRNQKRPEGVEYYLVGVSSGFIQKGIKERLGNAVASLL
jgi:hypothetical protein